MNKPHDERGLRKTARSVSPHVSMKDIKQVETYSTEYVTDA
jgi:hypothetical protein